MPVPNLSQLFGVSKVFHQTMLRRLLISGLPGLAPRASFLAFHIEGSGQRNDNPLTNRTEHPRPILAVALSTSDENNFCRPFSMQGIISYATERPQESHRP